MSVTSFLGEPPAGAQSTQGDGPPTEGLGSESAAAPPDSVPPPSEAPSEGGAKSESKSEKGTTKSKGDSKPGEDCEILCSVSEQNKLRKAIKVDSKKALNVHLSYTYSFRVLSQGSPKSRKSKKDRSPSPSASKKGTKSRSPTPPSSKKGSRSGSKSPSASRKGSRPASKGSRPGSKRAKSPSKYEWLMRSRHEDCAALGQFCAKRITYYL